ncbi:uncharacterized mitochondrial protein AtMg00810-like [Vicia villosa]|uniref:uncharacterized mitochondrial protein AtMg00810-like n=1 Tax=Vicia villosa TaxID=3911 RepID=UPI00273CD211|nr:uncharacterized mitochondrial protein AtMg00810-like [Vicia villosa]
MYLLVYVDEIIITGSNSALLNTIIHKMNSAFSLKHLGDLDYFLGIEVKKIAQVFVLLTQTKYIRNLLNKTHMDESSPINSPMKSSCKLTKHGSPTIVVPFMYRSVVGALQYVTITRPEIAYSVNKVC